MSRKSKEPISMEEAFGEEPFEQATIGKAELLPKIGSDLPIPQELVGCTQALFFEYRHQSTSSTRAPYCLKANDHMYKGDVYRSMYLIYISCDSEYEAAIKLVGNYSHWLKLRATTWFAPYLEAWNEELTLREEALARSKLVSLTQAGNVTAARTLLGTKKKGAGRPKKESRKDDTQGMMDLEDMLERTETGNHKKH